MKALQFLRRDEWTMGNGQCGECYGSSPGKDWWTTSHGHKMDCALAEAIQSLGGQVMWESKNERAANRPVSPEWEEAAVAWRHAMYTAVPIKL